jgi:hypothetical protein
MRTAREIDAAIEQHGARAIRERKTKTAEVARLVEQRRALDAQLRDAITNALAAMGIEDLLTFLQLDRSDLSPWLDGNRGGRRRRQSTQSSPPRSRRPSVTVTPPTDAAPGAPLAAAPEG